MYRSMREDLYGDKAKQEERTLRIDVPANDAAGSLTKKNFTNPIYQMMVVLDIAREVSDGKQELIDEQKYPRIEGDGQKNLPKKLRYGFGKANTQKRSAEEILEDINSRYIYTDAAKLKEYVEGLSTEEIKELAQLVDSKREGKAFRELPAYLQAVSELFTNAEGSKAKKNKIRDAIKSNTQQADSVEEQQKEPMSAEDRKAMQDRMDFLAAKEDYDEPMSNDELEELAKLRKKLAEFSIGQVEANPQTAERQLATQTALECLDNARVKVVQVGDAEIEGLFDNAHAQGAEMMAVNDKFNQQLEEYTDENADNIKLECGFPSEGLLLAGIPDKNIRLNGETLRKKIRKHGFSAEDLKNLPMYLQHPIAVFEGTHPNTYGVLIEMTLNGKNTLVAIDIKNAEIDGFTLVSSVYDKSATSVVTWINKGMMLSVDKTKALRYILTDAPIAPKDNRKGTSDTSIKNEEVISAAKVIQNFDTAKSFGENSSEFQIVYHGSNAMLDRFDHRFMGNGEGAQAYGWGTYVTQVKSIGESYASRTYNRSSRIQYNGDLSRYFRNFNNNGSTEISVSVEIEDAIREVAEKRGVSVSAVSYDELIDYMKYRLEFIKSWYEKITGDKHKSYWLKKVEETEDFVKFLESDDTRQKLRYFLEDNKHVLYEVDIPDNNGSNYLMYEQPIGKDAERIKRALYSELIQADPEAYDSENTRKILWNQLNSLFTEDVNGNEVYGNISYYLGSDMAASQFLDSMGYTGISYPAEYRTGGRKDGARNFVIFNERDLDIKDRAELMQRPNGVIYGWAQDGVIYLTKDGLNPNTPIHEYTHLWARAMMQNNPKGWQSIINTFKGTPLWDEVVNDPNYANLTSDDAICSEVLARYSGKRGAARFEKEAGKMIVDGIQTGEIDQVKSLIQRLRDALNKFWDWVGKELFDIKSFDSKESIADRVLYDLVNGTKLSSEKVSENLDSQKNSSNFAPTISKKQFVKLTRQIADKYRIRYRLSNEEEVENADAYYDRNEDRIVIQTPIALEDIEEQNTEYNGVMPEYTARMVVEETLFHENIHKFFEHSGKDHDTNVWSVSDLIKRYASKEWLDDMYENHIKQEYDQEEWDEELCTYYLSFLMANGHIGEFLQGVVKDNGWKLTEHGFPNEDVTNENAIAIDAYYDILEILEYNNYETSEECNKRTEEFNKRDNLSASAQTGISSNVSSLPDVEFSISPEERAAAQEDWENSLPKLFSIDESTKKEMERLSQDVSGSLLRINPASPELYNSSFMRWASNYIAKAFDRTEPIRVMMDNINKWRRANGMPPISGDLDVRTQIESVRSIVANKLHYIEFHQKKELREVIQALAKTVAESEFYQRYKTEKVTDDNGEPIILSPVELIERYLICQDNIERTQMGISRGLPEFTKRMGVNMVQYREEFLEAFGKTDEQREQIKDLWRKIRVMTDIVLDEGLEGGLISEEKYKEAKARKFYIPERDFADNESKEKDEDEKKKNEIINLSGIRKNRQLEAMKKAKGAESLARSPLAFIEHDVQDAIQKSEENKVKLTMYRLLQENAEWCEAVHMPKPSEVHFDEDGNRVTNAPSREERENMEWIRGQIRMLQAELSAATTEEEKAEIGEAIGELYDQMPYADSYETSELFRGQQKQDPTIVGVYVNGALCEMKFPGLELLANALNNKFDTRNIKEMISKLSSYISAQFTVNNPTFFVVNLARDIPFVLAKGFSEYGIEFEARFSANFIVCQRAVKSYLRNKEMGDKQTDKLLQDFLNGGGNMGYAIQEDIAKFRDDIRSLNPENKRSTTRRVVTGVLSLGYTEMGRVANVLNDYSEIITRFAAYKSVVDMGLGHNEGIKAAHNLSTNFNRKGLGRPFLNLFNSFAMFANATIQGAMGFWRSFDTKKHAMRAVAGFIFVPALLGFFDTILNPDDDDDEYAISDYDRDNKFILGNFRKPLNEQMKPFWCIGVNIALAMRGRRNAQQIANSMLSSILTNLLPLPQNLTNLPTLFVNSTLGGKDISIAQIVEQTLLPTMFQNVGQLADNRNFMGGKLRYDIGDIPEYTMADNEAALYKDLAYLAYRISGGDKDIASKHKTDGSGREVWADINPKQIHAALFPIPSGYMDFVCTAYGLVRSAVTQTPVEDNVRAKDIPIANRFYSSQNPDMFRASVAREARTIITRQDDMMDNYTAQMSKNFALSQQYYKMGLYDKAEQYRATAEKSKNLIMQENTMEYNVLKGCYEAYKKASIAYTAKQIGMDKKLFKKTYPQFDYEQMEANEKQAVSNLLTAIYIYNGQRVDTKVAQGLQSRYGALTVKDYLDWKDNNTKNK